MRIDPSTQSQLSSVSVASVSNPKAQFNQVLASKQTTVVSDLKKDLKQVSLDLKSGKITQEQASKQFVNVVVEKRNQFNLTPASIQKIQNAVGELVSQDPTFVSKLQNELKRI